MRAFLLVLAGLLAAAAAEKRVVCYYASWSMNRVGNGKISISDIDPTLCTHIIYSFVGINLDGSIRILDPNLALPHGQNGYALMNKLREKSPGTKTLIAIGGWNEESEKYSIVASNPSVRRRFVDNVVDFVKKYGFDGFDVDWEYPNQRGGVPADRKNYVSLLKELRERFDQEGLVLSAAVGASEYSASQSYEIAEVTKYLHFVNIMAYDLHGPWEKHTGMVAPLHPRSKDLNKQVNVEAVVKYWLDQGTPADKLVLGVPFYGKTYYLSNPSNNGIDAPSDTSGPKGPYTQEANLFSYLEICEKIRFENWNVVYDEEQEAPYAYKGNQWVSYDNERSMQAKAEFVKRMGLGGMMIWSVDFDDHRGYCNGETFPLLKVINRVYLNGDSGSVTPAQASAAKPTALLTTPAPQVTYQQTQPPASPAVSGNLCDAEGYVRDPQNCNVYYYCQPANGKYNPLKFTCPPSLVYNLNTHLCDYEYNVSC